MVKLSHRARSGLTLTFGITCLILGMGLVLFCLFSESWRYTIETINTDPTCSVTQHPNLNATCLVNKDSTQQVGGDVTDGLIFSTRRSAERVSRLPIASAYEYDSEFQYYSKLVLITGGIGLFCGILTIAIVGYMIARKANLRVYAIISSYAAAIFFTTGLVLYAKQLTASYSFLVYAYAPILFQMGMSLTMSTNVGLRFKGSASEHAKMTGDHRSDEDTNDIDLDAIDGGIVLGEIDVVRHSISRQNRTHEESKQMATKPVKKGKKGKKRNQQSAMSGDELESMDDDEEFARVAGELGDELQ